MLARATTFVAALTFVAGCGNDLTGPVVLHVANLSYTEATTCNSASCSGILRFRLMDQSSAGRAGAVTITGDGFTPTMSATTGSDGWGEAEWGFDPPTRPHHFSVCPAGVTDSSRCATGTTG